MNFVSNDVIILSADKTVLQPKRNPEKKNRYFSFFELDLLQRNTTQIMCPSPFGNIMCDNPNNGNNSKKKHTQSHELIQIDGHII